MKEVVPVLFAPAEPGRFIILQLLAFCREDPRAARPKRRGRAGNRLRRTFYNLPAGIDR